MEKKLKIVLAITVSVFVFEVTGGILSNSLALISDSLHVLLDFSAIGLSILAFRTARKKPHTAKHTFGLHRMEILAAFVNGILLLLVSGIIFLEAYRRFQNPPEVDVSTLFAFAAVGLLANTVMALILKKESTKNLNVKGSYLHVIGDLVSSIGVMAGAVIMLFFPNPLVDVIASIVIAGIITRSGVFLCKECANIFLEGSPKKIKVNQVSEHLLSLPEVVDLHDLHVWTITSNMYALSVHVTVKKEYRDQTNMILEKINNTIREKFGISHSTVQIEVEDDLVRPDKQ